MRCNTAEEKKGELNDEQLDNVDGGLFVLSGSVICGGMFPNSAERERYEKICKG